MYAFSDKIPETSSKLFKLFKCKDSETSKNDTDLFILKNKGNTKKSQKLDNKNRN
jgi:hypothetical protein